MIQILTIIAPLFLIIFASAILQYFYKMGDHWSSVLNEYALKLGLPVLIFSALAKTPFSFSSQVKLIAFNSIYIVGGLLLVYALGKFFRLKSQIFNTVVICFMFSNVAYLGIPTLVQISGESIIPTATLIVALYLFWIFTLGVGYLDYSIEKNKKDFVKKIVKNLGSNPLLISVLLGILVGSLKIPLPSILLKSLDMITASVTPTVLIVIGLFIGKSKIGKLSEWAPVGLFTLIKLSVLPSLFYFGAKFSGINFPQLSSSIIQAAMPLAITPFALADKYNLNKVFIARSIVLTTILSVITLPFWIHILR